MRLAALALASLLATGCATHSPALHVEPEGSKVVYELPPDRAQRIVHSVMAASFPGRDITPLTPPALGYSTYTRLLLDTWTTTAAITPVVAKAAGREFPAVRIEVTGSGTQIVSGRAQSDKFKERLALELDNASAKRTVEAYSIP